MRTVDTPTSFSRSWWAKVRGDVTLMLRLLRMTISYATAGRKVRKLYQQAEANGNSVWVDDLAGNERDPG